MRKRVEQVLGGRGLAVALGTFHSTCVRILRKWHAELGFRQSFVIYDDADQLGLIRDCLKGLNLSERVMSPRAVAARISRAKNEMQTPGRVRRRGDGLHRGADREDLQHVPGAPPGEPCGGFRRPPDAHGPAVPGSRARPGVLPEPLAVRPGGRVPGHQPRAVPDRQLPQPPAREPVRGGRRRPVHLPVARGGPQQHPGLRAGPSGLPGHQAGAELPLHAEHPGRRGWGRREQPGPEGEDALDRKPGRRADRRVPGAGRAGRGGVRRAARPGAGGRERALAGRLRRLLPDQRAVAGPGGRAAARPDALRDRGRPALLRAEGSQGPGGLPSAGGQPGRRAELQAHRERPAAGDRGGDGGEAGRPGAGRARLDLGGVHADRRPEDSGRQDPEGARRAGRADREDAGQARAS